MNFKNIRRFNQFVIIFFLLAFASAFALTVPESDTDIDLAPFFILDDFAPIDESMDDVVCGDEEDFESYENDDEEDGSEQDFNSLFENIEDDEFMFMDTSFAWDNKKINSGRFDYKTLTPGEAIRIPLVASSQEKFYAHPFSNYITSPFGLRGNRWHYGTDVKLKTGDPVKCAFDGIVRVIQFDRYGYGHVVVVRHHNGIETLYGHLSKVTVKTNEPIKAGEQVGLGGNTGRSTGSHLHFEIRYYGEPFNPEYIIDFNNYALKSDTLVLTRNNFEYLTELRRTVYYTVRKGDTLSGIAKRNGTTVSTLTRLNGIKSTTTLRVGRSLIVRSGKEEELLVVSNNPVPLSSPAQIPVVSAVKTVPAAPEVAANVYYTVRKGDTLSNIARLHGTTVSNLNSLNGIKSSTVLQIGRRLIVGRSATEPARQAISEEPAGLSTAAQSPDIAAVTTESAATTVSTVSSVTSDVYYTVRKGDTLSNIARLHGTTVNDICSLNDIKPTAVLHVGRTLITGRVTETARRTSSDEPESAGISTTAQPADVAAVTADSLLTTVTTVEEVTSDVYTVRSGDTLSGIARRHGTTISTICSLNGINPSTVLRVGQKLVVKRNVSLATVN